MAHSGEISGKLLYPSFSLKAFSRHFRSISRTKCRTSSVLVVGSEKNFEKSVVLVGRTLTKAV